MTEAYCVKCKAKKQMLNEEKVTMKNGKPATKGKCPSCGTGMYRIGGQFDQIFVFDTQRCFLESEAFLLVSSPF